MELTCKKCGAIGDPIIKDNPPHKSAYCSACGSWITHVRQQPIDDFTLYFGKYKDRNVKSMTSKEERQYLVWLYDNATSLKQNQRKILENLLHL